MRHFGKMHLLFSSLLLICVCSVDVFGQEISNEVFEKSKGKLKVPVNRYFEIIDNKVRLRQTAYSKVDSTLTFIVDTTCLVTAIFQGKVKNVLKGDWDWAVTVEYADYFMVYYGLTSCQVKAGDLLSINQKIGKIVATKQEQKEMSLMVYKNYMQKGRERMLGITNWLSW